jgi:NAD(P)-dependent dehydrogenase (short-subunit alcohol dehydrogenase family)
VTAGGLAARADLAGKVAVVTGGAGLIGFEVCRALVSAGAAVVVNGRDLDRCEAAVARLRQEAPHAIAVPISADVSDNAAGVELIAKAEARLGRVDCVVHCATSPMPALAGLFESTAPSLYPELMERTVCALMYLAHAAIPALRRAGGGSLIAFPSDAGKVAAPQQTLVGASRAGMMMFMRSLALEVSAYGIRCNCIAPTFVATPELRDAMATAPHGPRIARAAERARLGLPNANELAALALFLCSSAGAHLTGQVISVNGGLTAA